MQRSPHDIVVFTAADNIVPQLMERLFAASATQHSGEG
jgi:hypothetical protein